jgi:predicted TPR repeat methyltransferase
MFLFPAIFAALGFSILWLFWKLIGRPLAHSAGLIKSTAHDWEVMGWNAELDGRIEDALEAYNEALRLEPNNEIVKAKRDRLLQPENYSNSQQS